MQLLRVGQHGLTAIGRDDGQDDVAALGYRVLVRLGHGPRVERGDLVVVTVGHDHGLCGVAVGRRGDMPGVHPQRPQPRQVLLPIATQHGQWHGLGPQLTQAVGDVARAPPVLATQARHQERHIEDVQLAGQDLLGEATLEGHDGVERQGTTNEDGHGCVSNSQG
ncbi:hypothetical protein D9M69_585870 [compost metagenome]